jgi:hypothetical protein
MHELGTYPRAWTRELHKKIWGKQSKLNKGGKRQPSYVKPPESSVTVPNFNPTSQFNSKYSSSKRRDMLSSLDNL